MTVHRLSPAILSALEGAVGQNGIAIEPAGMAKYLGDWAGDYQGDALAVLRPGSVGAVQALMRLCSELGLGVIPQGGNTGLVSGAIDGAGAGLVVLSLERLNSIRQIDIENFALKADAGCVLQAIKDACQAQDCLFPLALGAQGSCQIGGNAASNAGGVNVLRYGMARDLILGLEVVLADGELWNGFSGLRKNNSGYDLKQLFIGSEGTLGIITGVEVKLFPKPAQTETAYLGLASFEAAIQLFNRTRRACSDLISAFEIIGGECIELARLIDPGMAAPVSAPVQVLIELSSGPGIDLNGLLAGFLADAMEKGLVTDAVLAASSAQARSFWAIREGLVEGQAKRGYHVRTDLSVKISDIPALIEQARRFVANDHPGWIPLAYGHAGDGNIHFNVLPPLELAMHEARIQGASITAGLYDIAVGLGGSISAEHGIGRSRVREFWAGLSPTHRGLVMALKNALDPKSLMNPGCLLPVTETFP
ncbi:FAD-binding oxidoreductase [Mesorhizobium sp. M2D.F.Ca.ET.185.01.1.1]|uniref:FAD-binding oxidoreductase n=3 Tax=Mesorhizobium TaxID=68287 RepID=UPI000FCA5076|nr:MULTISPECIES: FAD-binding oxidoreductase [unclassified Mesorhizobium]TGP80734.1 FAD-binding oxidoreductase [bacterium M00.F.Ca.ET.227.01.1.1]TGP90518.1 FAD-binding oxidoreductase [bacterium M00.F.Ca.ET.221.01.1.1]TGP97198.1 FAD-binding oxidoreductase [bacterium M00.F.Ca.ET.222.01.1.1]TGT75730.1 FAD-binding oxidoreductase [bacterium M00.F.Ca.ET.159.01.1.1]TGT84793.1 FAD-binding oxidoreductase [bacterium M00.F.Ca.ET.157.01.1.1]TGT96212.1 FAD-binding oxidoreductase [bacterium M00.F.Ca.ET.163.